MRKIDQINDRKRAKVRASKERRKRRYRVRLENGGLNQMLQEGDPMVDTAARRLHGILGGAR